MAEEIAVSDCIFTVRMALGGSGPTVGIKDSIDVAGFPTRCGSAVLRDAPDADLNAEVVARLIGAGAQIVGKTNMHEFAYGLTGINGWTGTPRNARYPGRVPGGSSSGSAAAVAAGLVEIGIGTDTGGSIRVPAACCGVFGLKPGFDRVSRRGVVPEASTLDCVGPLARDMAMLIRAMEMIAPAFRTQPMPEADAIVLGVLDTAAALEVVEMCDAAVTGTGLATRAISLPSFVAAYDAGLTLIAVETYEAIGRYIDDPALGDDIRARLSAARQVTPDRIHAAEAVREVFTAEVNAALEGVDAIVLPTLPVVPPTTAAASQGREALRLSEFVRPFNLSGHPALTIPLNSGDDRPVSLQLVGRMGGEEALCALGSLIAVKLSITPRKGIV